MTYAAVAALPYVSRETMERLEHYVQSLKKWTAKINLISKSSLSDVWGRHILDSVQLWPLADAGAGSWVDLGSGGGLPIVPLACIGLDQRPGLLFHAIESDQRKAAFLRHITHDLGLSLTVHAQRIDEVAPLEAQIVSARALTALPDLLGLCARHLAPNGTAILPKGANNADELRLALERWRFEVQTYESVTDSAATIFKIKDITRAGPS